jgi:hypothetical protein
MEKQAFNHKMEAIAKCLGYQWELYKERGDNYGHLIGSDQIKISAENGDYKLKGRIQFSSCYPQPKSGYAEYDYRDRIEITVSVDKTSEQIARDIQKRFLPAYLTNLQIIFERTQKSDKYEADKLATIKKVADHLQVEVPKDRDRLSIFPDMKEIYHIEAYSDTEVKFEIKTTPERAIEIIEILKK